MTGSHALSADFPFAADLDAVSGSGPRPAGTVDAPVLSPVHQLQDDLQRFHPADADSYTGMTADDAMLADKAPGWVRLMLPLTVSLGLWAVIFGVVGLVR
jgi:hypothetical protein